MSVDVLIDELIAALVATGRPAPTPPPDSRPLERLEEELATLRLPSALRRFWERVDARTLQLDLWPRVSEPVFALDGWLLMRDSTLPTPVGLFPWCYQSHDHLLIELEAPGAATGAIFERGFGGDYRLRFASLEDWLELAARAVRMDTTDIDDDFQRLAAARLDEQAPHPVYSTERVFPDSPEQWPAHWMAVTELARRLPPLDVPVLSVAEVHAARRGRAVRAAVQGTRVNLALGDEAARLGVADGTGILDVHCPNDVPGVGYLGAGRVYIEIEAERWTGPRPAVEWAGTSFAELIGRAPPHATAVRIRPSD